MTSYFVFTLAVVFLTTQILMMILPKEKKSSVKKVFMDNEFDEEVDKLLNTHKKGYVETTREFLYQSKTGITLERYIVINIISIALAFSVGFIIFDSVIGGAIVSPVGLAIPKRYVKARREKLILNFDKHLVMALERMISLLRSRKIDNVIEDIATAEDIDPFVRQEFAEMYIDLKSGNSVEDAFLNSYKRIGSSSLKLMYTQNKLDRELGLSLSELFTSIRDSIIRNIHEKDDAKLVTAQQKQTANFLIGLTVFVVGVMYLVNPSIYDVFTNSTLGRAILFFMIGWMATGQFLIRKIIQS